MPKPASVANLPDSAAGTPPSVPSAPLALSHLQQEFESLFDDTAAGDPVSSDFYDVHGLLTLSPRSKKVFFTKRDANADVIAAATPPTAQEASSSENRVYAQRFPQSLYGPMGERLPKLTPQNLNHPMGSSTVSHTPAATAASSGRQPLQNRKSSLSSDAQQCNHFEQRSLYELAEASLTTPGSRNFGREWAAALGVECATSLSITSCRLATLKTIAEDFASFVSPIACAIVESRNQLLSQRPFRSLPTQDHVYIVKGYVFVLSESASRVKLYGSHEGASRAANNEIRGVRTILGNPFLGIHTPLCCSVAFMGYHVFVTAPLPLTANPESSLMYGAFRAKRVAVSTTGVYHAHKIGEYLPLLRHNIPEKQLACPPGTLFSRLPEAKRSVTTSVDVKQVYNPVDGAAYIIDAARIIPPAVCQTAEYSKIKSKDDGMGTRGQSRHPLEDDPSAHLSVLFRPEFMRNTCPIQLNADANTPHQPLGSQESISHAIHVVYTQNCWNLLLELVTAEQNKTLRVADLSTLFHKHGVNLRYMGKIYGDLDISVKSEAVREQIKSKIALEAACRAFKTLVFQRISHETRYRGEENLIVTMFRQFLLCADQSSHTFWNEQMRECMTRKFGFYSRVAKESQQPVHTTDGRLENVNLQDANGVNVYKCLSNIKRRVETVPSELQWQDIGGGMVILDAVGIDRLRRQNEDSLGVLYPLLGANARENSELLIRAQQLISVEIASDLRGKKILVTFRPKVKPCTPLILSAGLQALAECGPTDLKETLGQRNEDVKLCETVEAACRAELAAITKISESDPRATLPLQILSLCFVGRNMLTQASSATNRCFELRKNVPIDVVIGSSCVEMSRIFAKAQSADRAETLCVDGLNALRGASTGVDLPEFVRALVVTAQQASSSILEPSGRPQMERTQRILDYLYFAALLAEKYQLPVIVDILWLIGNVRKRFANAVPCFRCSRQAELCAKGDYDNAAFEKLTSEKDAASIGSKPITTTTAVASAQSKARSMLPGAQRRKREESRKDDDEVAEVFAKKTVEKVHTLFLDGIGGPGQLRPYGAQSVGPGSSQNGTGSSAANSGVSDPAAQAQPAPQAATPAPAGAAAANPTAVPQLNPEDLPVARILADMPKPSTICRVSRYMCKACGAKHPAAEKEPVMREVALVFACASQIAIKKKDSAPLDRCLLGEALLNVGVLELNPDAVSSSIVELSLVYGPSSRVVVGAMLQLADVLLESANRGVPSVSTGLSGSVTVVSPIAQTTNTGGIASSSAAAGAVLVSPQQATVGVQEAEVVLHDALDRILKRHDLHTMFHNELTTVVTKLLQVLQLYALHPVAKREHAAAHYLCETLPPVLGVNHPLVAAAYNATKHYYVQLAKKRVDRVAASTALQTAGQYACHALMSRISVPDIEEELDSHLTVMADDIIKVLRAGSANDRKASEELYRQCQLIVADSPYKNNPIIAQRMQAMDEIFKAQLKVMEQSEALSRMLTRIGDAQKQMIHLSNQIKRHRNRVDLYGHQCLDGITDIFDEVVKATKNSKDAEVARRMEMLTELYVYLTKKRPSTASSSANGETGDSGWEMFLGGPQKFGDKKLDDERASGSVESHGQQQPPQQQTSQQEGSGGDGGGPRSALAAGSRVYVSPYAVLGGAPATLDDDQQEVFHSPQNPRSASGASRMGTKLRHGHRDTQRSMVLSPAGQLYLASIAEHPESAGLATRRQPETVERLSALLPRISQGLASRNLNPIRSYAQQASSKK